LVQRTYPVFQVAIVAGTLTEGGAVDLARMTA
jgi:hypothetical protein